MLEKQIEKKVCDYAKNKQCLAYKFTSPARAAVPDRMFISPEGVIWFAEFKQTGKKPTPAQEREIQRLRDRRVKVYVIDTVEDGCAMVDGMVSI